jgi:hypothetical protein
VRVFPKGLRGDLHGEAAVQAHEGPNRSRRPRALRALVRRLSRPQARP